MRFISEFWREPDIQLGFIYGGWLTMGQVQSLVMLLFSIWIYFFIQREFNPTFNFNRKNYFRIIIIL